MTKLNTKVANSNVVTDSEVSIDAKNLYTTAKSIKAATDTAAKLGNSLQVEYQKIACSVIKHLDDHKDIRVVRHMLDTLPEGMRKKSMSAFLDRFAAVSFEENEETGKVEVTYSKGKQSNLVAALTFPWWKASVETQYKPFDFQVELAKLIARAEGKLKKGVSTERGDKVTPEQIAQVSAVFQAIAMAQVDQPEQVAA